jgi:hypothetical protein
VELRLLITREIELNHYHCKWWVRQLVLSDLSQLYVKYEGVHVLLIRDYRTHADLPGVLKGDLQSRIDQGFIHFILSP